MMPATTAIALTRSTSPQHNPSIILGHFSTVYGLSNCLVPNSYPHVAMIYRNTSIIAAITIAAMAIHMIGPPVPRSSRSRLALTFQYRMDSIDIAMVSGAHRLRSSPTTRREIPPAWARSHSLRIVKFPLFLNIVLISTSPSGRLWSLLVSTYRSCCRVRML